LTQQNGLVERLRVELNSATEAKNEIENRYGDSLKEIETLKEENKEVKKYSEITYVCYVICIHLYSPFLVCDQYIKMNN